MLFLFCYLFFIPILVNSGNVTSSKEIISKTLVAASNNVLNKTKLSVASEGGTLLASSPELSLPKENLTNLLILEEETGKPKQKPIVARKGVDNNTENHTVPNADLHNAVLHNSSITLEPGNALKVPYPPKNNLTSINISNVDAINKTIANSVPQNTILPKKPLILSYEALVSADKNIQNDIKIPATIQSKAKTQIPSPNEGSIVKAYPSKVNSHPGMIMPIVITILVVPMFAIVGYMALRRGQEAWKNRHYKRMDFLLDGMYND